MKFQNVLNEMADLTVIPYTVSNQVMKYKQQILDAENLEQARFIFITKVLDPIILGKGITSKKKYDEYVRKARDCKTLDDMFKLIDQIEKGGRYFKGKSKKIEKNLSKVDTYNSIPIKPNKNFTIENIPLGSERAARNYMLNRMRNWKIDDKIINSLKSIPLEDLENEFKKIKQKVLGR